MSECVGQLTQSFKSGGTIAASTVGVGSQGSSRRLVFDPGIPLPLTRSLQRRKVRAFDRRHGVLARELRSIWVIQGAVRRWLMRRVAAPAIPLREGSRRGSRSVRRGKLKARVPALDWSSVDDLLAEFGVSTTGVIPTARGSVLSPLSSLPVHDGHGDAAACGVGSVSAAGAARVPGLRSGVLDGDATEGVGAATHPTARPPSWPGFVQLPVVRRFLHTLATAGVLSVGKLRRSINAAISARRQVDVVPSPPSAMDPEAMFDAGIIIPGMHELPVGDHHLNIEGMDALHVHGCPRCSLMQAVDPACTWFSGRLCFINGFCPATSGQHPVPVADVNSWDGNHPSLQKYHQFAEAQIGKLLAQGVIEDAGPHAILSPLGVAFQSSKVTQAQALTGIRVCSDSSVAESNAFLRQALLPELKERLIFDLSISGVNREYLPRRFQYIDIDDAIALMTPGCVMVVMDMEAYFLQFPLAKEARYLCSFRWNGRTYQYKRFSFGGRIFPFLASWYTAELCQGLRSFGVPIIGMVDDLLAVGHDMDDAIQKRAVVKSKVRSVGLSTVDKKDQMSTRVTYVGYRLDSTAMTISFDPQSSHAFALQLALYIRHLVRGGAIDHDIWHHVCGKTVFYAAVLQSGRSRMTYFWAYLRHGQWLSSAGRALLLEDAVWWLAKVRSWADGSPSGYEFPIINSAVFLADPSSMLILVGDMSGDDGVGGVHGRLTDVDPMIFSAQWPDELRPASSFVGELCTLALYLRMMATHSSPPVAKMLLFVTDNEGVASALNAGRCKASEGLTILREILDLLDWLGWSLVCLWCPREENDFADHLSHLASLLNCSFVAGRVSDVTGAGGKDSCCSAGDLGVSSTARHQQDVEDSSGGHCSSAISRVQGMAGRSEPGAGSDLRHGVGISYGMDQSAERVNGIARAGALQHQDAVGSRGNSLAFNSGHAPPLAVHRAAAVRGFFGSPAHVSLAVPHPGEGAAVVESQRHHHPAARRHAVSGSERAPAVRRS